MDHIAESRGGWLGAGLAALVAVFLVRHVHVSGAPDLVLCLFRRVTGLACPGCGLSRAFLALARGDLTAAWLFHPLAPVLGAELVVGWLLWGRRAIQRSEPLGLAWDRVALAHGAALIALWATRMASGTLPT